MREALEAGLESLPELEERWKARLEGQLDRDASFEALFGYDPPGSALRLAWLSAFLYEQEERPEDAQRAARLLRRMADYRDWVPEALRGARVEYAHGLPAVPSFFHLADYAEAWGRVAGSGHVDAGTAAVVAEALADSADFIFVFPEWGAHNRAMLRAESLAHAARALPQHARAEAWSRMATILAEDSIAQWEIEDAAHYQPIWMLAALRYAQASGDWRVVERPEFHLALRSLLALLTPRGTLPAFGDAWFDGGLARLWTSFVWGSALFEDGELAWAANRVACAMGDASVVTLGRADLAARTWHLREQVPREYPPSETLRLDPLVNKKIVHRTGWSPHDFYLCANFKDEGDDALVQRSYLRETLAVAEEKMHHGHEDEGSLVLFMHQGSVLLHDAGYRAVVPSGPHGAWRADHFHNRVVVRRQGESPLVERLLDSGAYDPVRTYLVDRVSLEGADYARLRVEGPDYRWDRILLSIPTWGMVLVVDHVPVREADAAQLWAGQHVLELAPRFARTANRTIGSIELPVQRELVLTFLGDQRAVHELPLERHGQPEHLLVRPFGERDHLATVLTSVPAGASGRDVASGYRVLEVEGGFACELSHGDERLTVALKLDLDQGLGEEDVRPRYRFERGALRTKALACDGDLTLLWSEGSRRRWESVNLTRLDVGAETVFQAAELQLFQTSARSDHVGRVEWRRWGGPLD